jgi:hypothetical protein
MSIVFTTHDAVCTDIVAVTDAEVLLEWLQSRVGGRVDLAACTHLHAATLQVLMAARPVISAWPTDPDLARWLHDALHAA